VTGQLAIDCGDKPVSEDRPATRRCGCPCKASIDHLGERAKYLDANHGMRAYRARVKAEMQRVGLPPSPSLRAARVSRPTTDPNGESQKPRNTPQKGKPSGLQVSYYKLLGIVQDELNMEREHAEALLERALSARQREQLDQRRAAA
jgi:hypothetical protein